MRLSSPTTTLLALAAAATAASALNLFVADYSGSITALSLSESNNNNNNNNNNSAYPYTLNKTFETTACGPSPAWLTLDVNRGLLFCVNEGLNSTNGSLSSFSISANGRLNLISQVTTLGGPVSAALYGNPAAAAHGIVVAHYGGSAVSTFGVSASGNLTLLEEFVFANTGPGPDVERQDQPHPHQALLDPTGQFILVPDLGADLVRVFGWHVADLKLEELEPLVADAGSGPRHIAFWTPYNIPGGTTYMYLVEELFSRVSGYAVEYSTGDNSGLTFRPIGYQSTLGYHNLARRNAPAEIQISPDNRFLLISNRNSTAFTLPNPDIGPSDSISTFELSTDTGNITAHQLSPSGGLYPRHFATNSAGNLVAVALQLSGSVAIFPRDTATGLMMQEPVAIISIPANVTTVMWDEVARSGVTGLTGMGF